jgi:hypothetical protein
MQKSLLKTTGIFVSLEVDAAKNVFSPFKSIAMNKNQKDPTCCTTNSGCCGITDLPAGRQGMGCC